MIDPEIYKEAHLLVGFVSKALRDLTRLLDLHAKWKEERDQQHGRFTHVWGCDECVKALEAILTPEQLTEARHCGLCLKRAHEAARAKLHESNRSVPLDQLCNFCRKGSACREVESAGCCPGPGVYPLDTSIPERQWWWP